MIHILKIGRLFASRQAAMPKFHQTLKAFPFFDFVFNSNLKTYYFWYRCQKILFKTYTVYTLVSESWKCISFCTDAGKFCWKYMQSSFIVSIRLRLANASQELSLVFLLISNLTNGLRLHRFLVTKSVEANKSVKTDANEAH